MPTPPPDPNLTDPMLPPVDPGQADDQKTLPLPSSPHIPGQPLLPHEPRRPDAQTLVGSGGLDPNPDFSAGRTQRTQPVPGSGRAVTPPPQQSAGRTGTPGTEFTQPHVVPFQHTLVHVPPERAAYNQHTQPGPAQGGPARPQSPYGMPTYTQPPPPNRAANTVNLPPRRRKRQPGCLGCSSGCLIALVGLVVTLCGGLTLIALVLTATLGAELENRLQEQIAAVDTYTNFQSTFFYDRGGTLLYEAFNEGRRVNVRYEDFPQYLIDATIAIEDDTFWTNPGFEVEATLRAFFQFLSDRNTATGGSTITQQLVRNVLFEPEYRAERSVQRKIEEIALAFLLTQRRSKQEIITLYLNEIYYGNLAYGAEAAARTFFNKSVNQLTLAEAALLAGLPQAPANLDPFSTNPQIQAQVNLRWRTVLGRMLEEGFITQAEHDAAIAQGYTLVEPEAPLRAPHFTVYAQGEFARLMQRIGYPPSALAPGGFRVYTTLDLRVNALAEQAARTQIAGLAANRVGNAAVIILQPLTGEIIGMVGSVDYNNDAIDGRVNVAISPRQPGSTVKAFTYAAAMEMGFTPANIIWDTPTTIDGYSPVNYDRTFHGPVRMRDALANSYNVPAVQTLRRVGVQNLLNFVQRFGIESWGTDASRFGLSLTLGGGEISLLELARGFGVFANSGAYVPSTAIRCVLDNVGNILYQYNNGCLTGTPNENTVNEYPLGTQAIDPRIAYIISDILADNAARTPAFGSRSPLFTPGIASSVKTGTTDNFRDNWTVGYTRNMVVGVWVGNSDGTPMINTTGVTGAAPIWNAVITGIYASNDLLGSFALNGILQPDRAEVPPGMSLRALCNIYSLRVPAETCAQTVREWMLDGPAGVPDGQGGLIYPPITPPPSNERPASGPWLIEIEPDIYRVLANPIPPEVAAGIVFAVSPGQPQPPPPIYCQVPVELEGSAFAARDLYFIAPPPFPQDAAAA
ncbi:MAG: transglycosylase domain-containing protein, partial [Anaerolinea sp.]|nr:transglycosylase domain-containing protein [Anaerolinea sp.]